MKATPSARCWATSKRPRKKPRAWAWTFPRRQKRPTRDRVVQNRTPTAQQARVQPTVRGLPVPANAAGASYLSPRLKARMDELGLHAADLAGVAGSGAAGRVTIEDFEKFIASLEKQKMSQRLLHARGRGRRHAPQLDAPARHRRPARASRRRARAPQNFAIPSPARRFTPCARWRWRWRKTPRPPAGWSAARSCIRRPLTWASPSKPRTACWCR